MSITQIVSAPFEGEGSGLSHLIFGLGDDGHVYRWNRAENGWIKYPNNVVGEIKADGTIRKPRGGRS